MLFANNIYTNMIFNFINFYFQKVIFCLKRVFYCLKLFLLLSLKRNMFLLTLYKLPESMRMRNRKSIVFYLYQYFAFVWLADKYIFCNLARLLFSITISVHKACRHVQFHASKKNAPREYWIIIKP